MNFRSIARIGLAAIATQAMPSYAFSRDKEPTKLDTEKLIRQYIHQEQKGCNKTIIGDENRTTTTYTCTTTDGLKVTISDNRFSQNKQLSPIDLSYKPDPSSSIDIQIGDTTRITHSFPAPHEKYTSKCTTEIVKGKKGAMEYIITGHASDERGIQYLKLDAKITKTTNREETTISTGATLQTLTSTITTENNSDLFAQLDNPTTFCQGVYSQPGLFEDRYIPQ